MAKPQTKPTDKERRAALREWQDTPSRNPEFKGTTPAELARALLKRRPAPGDHSEKEAS